MKRRVGLSLVGLAFFVLVAVPLSVFAQSSGQQNGNGSTGDNGQNGQGQSQQCTDVTSRTGEIVQRYNQNKEQYMNAFQNMYQNMEELMLKFQNYGYDTAQLEEDLAQFNNMIQNTNRYYNEFMNGIENSKNSVCGNGNSDAGQEFTRAREQLMLCKDEMLQLRTFAQETMRQDLLDLKAQVEE